ncbi:hypothetical protein B0I35DRAFT_455424 [Stachybotrys elegans]|uniref:Uncharacterized protein n=1 Tax=Stachybotrys elegans TaxID=80388 RepID=A0A8K0SG26_9HYPO|nr:hypothetical protein B0I35DRAFT_455424 [Stachybotrys elegans]
MTSPLPPPPLSLFFLFLSFSAFCLILGVISTPSTTAGDASPRAREPLISQKTVGSDMTISCLIKPHCPKTFPSSSQHHIKGLNTETIAIIELPTPTWLAAPEYAFLRADPDDPDSPSTSAFFSLNVSIYNQQIIEENWSGQWFYMTGRVHPFALTWEIQEAGKHQDSAENSAQDTLVDYTIAALIVRDFNYQPILPRTMSSEDLFPAVSPTVSFLGSVMKCCGLVRLSTFIAPGDSNEIPKRGFHTFFAFVIFPIRLNPWASLCKKMTERRDTQFQTNSLLSCTGKVAGLLDHRLLVHPPPLEQDYVFIVVPDSWTFLDKSFTPSNPATPSAIASANRLPSSPSSAPTSFERAMAKFTTPRRNADPSTPSSSMSPTPAPTLVPTPSPTATATTKPHSSFLTVAPSPTLKRACPSLDPAPSNKKPRQLSSQQSLNTVLSSVENESFINLNAASFVSHPDEPIHSSSPSSDKASLHATPSSRPFVPTTRPGISPLTLDSITASSSDPTNRPQRSRMPTKKYEE